MQLGIFARTFAVQGALPVLHAVAQAGYETAQFNFACLGLASMPDEITDETVKKVAAASRETGISIAAVSGTYNMIHPDLSQRARGLQRLEVIIRCARAMGTEMVTLCTGTRDSQDQWRAHPDNGKPDAWHDLCTEMEKALAIAERHAVDLGIEPELANVVSSAAHARRLIDELKSPRLRVVLDPANLFEVVTSEERLHLVEQSVELLADRLSMAHAKDRDAQGNFVAAGKGVIDFSHFIGCLRKAGFAGPLVTHGLSEPEAPGAAHFLKALLQQ